MTSPVSSYLVGQFENAELTGVIGISPGTSLPDKLTLQGTTVIAICVVKCQIKAEAGTGFRFEAGECLPVEAQTQFIALAGQTSFGKYTFTNMFSAEEHHLESVHISYNSDRPHFNAI